MTGKKLPRVSLTVKPSGLTTQDISSGDKLIDVSIYRISYCSADATFDRVVAFIATNKNETMECHAFLTSKKKVAQAAALTISQAFTIAFEKWEAGRKNKEVVGDGSCKENLEKNHNQCNVVDKNNALIDLSCEDSLINQSDISCSDSQVSSASIMSPPPSSLRRDTSKSLTTRHVNGSLSFDGDLDDSFSKLAESRSCVNNNLKSPSSEVTSLDVQTNNGSLTVSTNPFATDFFNSGIIASVLPNNLQSLEILAEDDEFNQFFTSGARSTAREDAEKDFFAEKDDLFSL